jgi:protein-disulfide isomerase
MPRQQLYIVIGVVALVAIGLAYYVFGVSSTSAVSDAAVLKIAPDDHTQGSPKATVTLIEYAAPSCPVCAAFDAQVFPQLKTTYIDTGKVYYVFRVFPLRPADGAAEAMARCLPKESYFQFIELLFRRQAEWDPEFGVADAHAALVQIGHTAGLTNEQSDRCIEDKAVQQRINDIAAAGQARFNISATPTLILNGQALPAGAMPWSELQPKIEAELKKVAAPPAPPAPH